MRRVVLIHRKAEDATPRARRLERAGYGVQVFADQEVSLFKWLAELPDAFVIDLDKTPSFGRAKGLWLRKKKFTRGVPLVFVGGAREVVAQVRGWLPDATFATDGELVDQVERAIAAPPIDPVVADPMAPYRGASLVKKLGIREHARVALLGAPKGFEAVLGELPTGASVVRSARGRADVALLFVDTLKQLRQRFESAERVTDGGPVWLIWPKRDGGRPSDVTQAAAREHALAIGWVDYKFASIDATWTGLVVRRRRTSSPRRRA